MDILKTSLRIVFLILLCIPVLYIEYYIMKNTAADVMNHKKKKSSEAIDAKSNYHSKEYLRVAK
mgnify:CR=1 FL=1